MLENIKSIYFLKIIFFYVDDMKKLLLVKYNKKLQNKLDLNLYIYRLFSEKYIIYETNEKAKIYNAVSDQLQFEGEYLNGKKTGKGREYDINGNIIFEGEFLNGKRNGKGKEYIDRKLIYEGEYLKGLKWNIKEYDNITGEFINELKEGKGFIKEYNSYGSLAFEGEYVNGKKNGKGKEYKYDKKIFEGEYLNGKKWNGKGFDLDNNIVYELKNGKGFLKEYNFNNILIFEGEFLNGEKNGKGTEYFEYNEDLMLEGEVLIEEGNGAEKKYNKSIPIFEGQYLNGKRNGKGKEYNEEEEVTFEGEYLYGHKLKGKVYIKEKLEYEGDFLYERKWNGKGYDIFGYIIYELNNGNGRIKEYYYNGVPSFEGELLDGKKNGKGKEYDFNGELLFSGEYLNGIRNGKGEEYDNRVLIFEGEYLNGIKNGKGKEFNEYGKLIFEGEYLNGKRKIRI